MSPNAFFICLKKTTLKKFNKKNKKNKVVNLQKFVLNLKLKQTF